jgi:hypothetical protein
MSEMPTWPYRCMTPKCGQITIGFTQLRFLTPYGAGSLRDKKQRARNRIPLHLVILSGIDGAQLADP